MQCIDEVVHWLFYTTELVQCHRHPLADKTEDNRGYSRFCKKMLTSCISQWPLETFRTCTNHISAGGFCGITQRLQRNLRVSKKGAKIAERDESIICSQECLLYACWPVTCNLVPQAWEWMLILQMWLTTQ